MFQNIWFVAAMWMGLALVASLISIWSGISVALIEILVGVLAGNFLHLHASNEWINFLALLGSGVLTFPRRSGNRSAIAQGESPRVFAHRHSLVRNSVRRNLALRAIRSRLATASGSDRGHRAFHNIGCSRLRGDDRRWIQRHRDGENDSGRVFHHGLRNRARARRIVRELQHLAARFRGHHVRRALVHAGMDERNHRQVRRDSRERTRSKIHLLHLVFSRRPRDDGKKRSGPSGISRGPGRGGRFSARQNARASNAHHRVRDLHAVLFHQSRTLCFAAGRLARARNYRGPSPVENGDKNCRRLAAGADALHESTPGCLHDASHGDRAYLWHNLGPIRVPK